MVCFRLPLQACSLAFAVALFVRFAWLVKGAVSLFGLPVSACLRQLRWVRSVFWVAPGFRCTFTVWLLLVLWWLRSRFGLVGWLCQPTRRFASVLRFRVRLVGVGVWVGFAFGLFRSACCRVGKLFVSVLAFQVLSLCCLPVVSCLLVALLWLRS